MRVEVARCVDQKNARSRADWAAKYYGAVHCADWRTPQEELRFISWYMRKLKAAQAYLQGRSTYDSQPGLKLTFVPGKLPRSPLARIIHFRRKAK